MVNSFPTFSIIIPTYQRYQELRQCLNCLAPYFDPEVLPTHCFLLEVIVSDDALDPQLCAHLRQHYSWCTYTAGPARGPAANRNHGAHQASGDWLVFTDDDCLPQPGWIEAFSQHTEHCDVMEGKTGASNRRTRHDQDCPINETGGYLWSCNFAIRREAFLHLGGFNENFPVAAMEDVELNYRINKSDLRLLFLSTAEVKHPWRMRKGRSFMRAKARSISTYVGLYPEVAPMFYLSAMIQNLLRNQRQTLMNCFVLGTVQGLARQVVLDIYGTFTTWQTVKKTLPQTTC